MSSSTSVTCHVTSNMAFSPWSCSAGLGECVWCSTKKTLCSEPVLPDARASVAIKASAVALESKRAARLRCQCTCTHHGHSLGDPFPVSARRSRWEWVTLAEVASAASPRSNCDPNSANLPLVPAAATLCVGFCGDGGGSAAEVARLTVVTEARAQGPPLASRAASPSKGKRPSASAVATAIREREA